MIAGFKKFIVQGNVVDLAVGVIIGSVFGAVVKSFTDDVLMAIIGGIFGKPSFGDLTFTVGDGVVKYGLFLNALITFLITAAAIYFFVVTPINKLKERRASGEDAAEPTNEEKMVALLEQIAAK